MQHAATTWTFASADNRLAELMKAFGCADVTAPVDAEAFGKRAGELLTRVVFSKRAEWLARVVSGDQRVLRDALKIDRVRPGGP
jgi:hypothetical protein